MGSTHSRTVVHRPYPDLDPVPLEQPILADLDARAATISRLLGAPLASELLHGPVELIGVVTNRLSEFRIGPALIDTFAVSISVPNRTAVLRAPAGVAEWIASDGVYTVSELHDPVELQAVVAVPYAHLDTATIDTATRLWEPYHEPRTGSYISFSSALTAALALHAR